MERKRSTQFGEGRINGQSNRGRVGLTLELGEFFYLWGHTYLNEIFAYF